MATLKSQVIASSQTWTAPAGVSAVWLSMVGGGAAVGGSGNSGGFIVGGGSGGSGELCLGRLVPVTPLANYSVVIGAAGTTGATWATRPNVATQSSFNGYIALGAGDYPGPFYVPGTACAGGGAGGSTGGFGGGGFDKKGRRETGQFTGGAGGSYNSAAANNIGGTLGGQPGLTGANTADPDYGGGPGAGAIWGGNDGTAAHVSPTAAGSATHYGAGCGGAGEPASGTVTGASGSPGVVILSWVE